MELKDKLKEKRMEAGLTQKELAEILHVSRQTISSWEVGRTYPDLDVLVAISELYGTPLDDLLKEDSSMVKDITSKVKTSQRRKQIILFLSAMLIVLISYGAWNVYRSHLNKQANEEGLRPSDLLASTWQMNYDPTQLLEDSLFSFGEKDLIVLNKYPSDWPTPVKPDEEKVKERNKKREEKGRADGIGDFKQLSITLDGNKYIVDAYGYHQVFTKISSTLIRDRNGIEYHKIMDTYDQDSIRWIDENRKKSEY